MCVHTQAAFECGSCGVTTVYAVHPIWEAKAYGKSGSRPSVTGLMGKNHRVVKSNACCVIV